MADLYGRRYDRRAGIQCPESVKPEYELEFFEVYMAYALLFFGSILSLSLMFMEKKFSRRARRRAVSFTFDFDKEPGSAQRRFRYIAGALIRLAPKLR